MMNTTTATSVLRQFEEHRLAVVLGQDKRWRWRRGTLLFPEGRCCYCGAAVRSNRVWVVEDNWLRGQLALEGGKAVFEKPCHPHADTFGGLCTGGPLTDPLTALFFGVNPADAIMRELNIREWYGKMFDHTCGKDVLPVTPGLFLERTRRHRVRGPNCECGCGCNPADGRCGCGCTACQCDRQRCEVCGRRRICSMDAENMMICRGCRRQRWVQCVRCGRRVRNLDERRYVVEGRVYCPAHNPQGAEQPPAPTWTLPVGTTTATVVPAREQERYEEFRRWMANLTEPAVNEPVAVDIEPDNGDVDF